MVFRFLPVVSVRDLSRLGQHQVTTESPRTPPVFTMAGFFFARWRATTMKRAIYTQGLSDIELEALDKFAADNGLGEPGGNNKFFRNAAKDGKVVFVSGEAPNITLTHGGELYANKVIADRPHEYIRVFPKFEVSVTVAIPPAPEAEIEHNGYRYRLIGA